jgi:hypothetical protein
MKEARIKSQENVLKINEKEIENIENLLVEKEERLQKEQEKINSMMNSLRCEQIENEQIRAKCLRLQKEVDFYKLHEAKNTNFTDSPSWAKDSETISTIVEPRIKRQEKNLPKTKKSKEKSIFDLKIEKTFSFSIKSRSKQSNSLKDQEIELKECILHKTEQELKEHAKKIAAHINEYRVELDIRETDLDHRLLEIEFNEKKIKEKYFEMKLIEDHLKQAQIEIFEILEVFPFFEEYLAFVFKILNQLGKEKNHISVLFQKISEIQEKFQQGLLDITKSKERFEGFALKMKKNELKVQNNDLKIENNDLKIENNDFSVQDCLEMKEIAQELQEKLRVVLEKEKEILIVKEKLRTDFENNEKTVNLLQGLKIELEHTKITQEQKIKYKMEKLMMMKKRLTEMSKVDN